MFYHLRLLKKVMHSYDGSDYEIVIYEAEEDQHLRGYVSSGGFGERIAEMPGNVATDMRATSDKDPAEMMIETIKSEIDAGKIPVSA